MTDPRECACRFTQAVTRVEEMLAGERPSDDTAIWPAVIARLERASSTRAPRAVLSARTAAALHAALLDWQDAVEIRNGRRAREPRMEVKRPPDLAELGVQLAARHARRQVRDPRLTTPQRKVEPGSWAM